jgi:L-threonylcarbamoyladenylate synthase
MTPARICHDGEVIRLAIDAAIPLETQLGRAADAIRSGQVVAYPTDTLYGLAVDPLSVVALERLFRLKGRDSDRAVALIAADGDQVAHVAEISPLAARLAARFWPGPLTLLLPARPSLAPAVVRDGLVGVRVPDHAVARTLARLAGCPVTATSANPSGDPGTPDPDRVARLLPKVDVLVDAGTSPGGNPSTIVNVSGATVELVRAGAIAWERVLESIGSAAHQ